MDDNGGAAKRGKTKKDWNVWHSLQCNNEMDLVHLDWTRVINCQTEPTKINRLRKVSSWVRDWTGEWTLFNVRDQYRRQGGIRLLVYMNGVYIRLEQINDAIQTVLPTSLWGCIIFLVPNPIHAGHSGEQRLHDTLGGEYYWYHITNDAYTTFADCYPCAL